MSDASEVKRIRVFHLSELLCPRGLLVADESPMPDHNSELLPVTDHDRIMAERDELWKRATKFVMPGEMDTGESIEHYIKTLEQAIASQAKVIEKLHHDCGNHDISQADIDWCVICDRESNEATIARQARVIENIKQALDNPATRSNEALVQIREVIEKGEWT